MRTAAIAIIAALVATPAVAQGVDFTMTPRAAVDWASVPVLRSVQPNTNTVLDIAPNGRPAPHGALGMAWLHVCNEDPDNHDGGFSCAVVAADDEAMRFGSSSYGERARPIEFLIGNRIVGRMTANGLTVGDFDTSKIMRALAHMTKERNRQEKKIRQLERQLQQLQAAVEAMAAR